MEDINKKPKSDRLSEDDSFLHKFTQRKQFSQTKRMREISILRELDNFARSKQFNQLLKPSIGENYNDEGLSYVEKEIKDKSNEFNVNIEGNYLIEGTPKKEEEDLLSEHLEFRGTNIMSHLVNLKAGNNMNLSPQPEISTENPHDVEKIEKIQAILDAIWDKQNLQDHVNEQIYIAKLKPITLTHFEWDNNIKNIPTASPTMTTQGDFSVKIVDPMNVWWDPNAYKVQDMDFFIIGTKMTRTKLRETFKGNLEVLKKLTEEYLEQSEPIDTTDTSQIEVLDDREVISDSNNPSYMLYTYYEKTINDEGETIIGCHYILGEDLLLHSVEDIGISIFPIAALRDFKIPQSFFGYSTGQAILPYQKYLTILELKEAKLLKTKGKEVILLNKEFGLDSNEVSGFFDNKESGSVLVAGVDYKQKNTPIANQVYKMTIGENEIDFLQKNQQFTIELANKTLGITDAYEASSFGSQQTKGGVASIISKANTIDSIITNNLNIYLKDMFKIILEYIKFNYTPRAFSVNMEGKTAQSRKYSESIFENAREKELDTGSLEGKGVAEEVGLEQALAQTGANPMETMMGGGDPMMGDQPPMGGNPMEAMMGGMGGGNPMEAMMGGASPSPTDKFRTLAINPGSDAENELTNEFVDSDFDIDIDVFNQTSSQKTRNDEYMLNYVDRKIQQGNVPPELLRTVLHQVGFSNQFINKAVDSEQQQQDKMEQQQQAQAQQQQQMQAASMMNQQSMGQEKIKADMVKAMLTQATKEQTSTNKPK